MDELRAVAIPATLRGVFAFEHVSGQGVVERFLAAVAPIDQLETAAVVLDMTGVTFPVVIASM